MSLSGFRARNHPQQRTRDDVDDRAITWADFIPLHVRFGFTIDAAAAPHNARLGRYWTYRDNALLQCWDGERIWCNPPYSNIEPWVCKAWDCGAELVVMLVPANRTEQGWWQRHVEPFRGTDDFHVEFLPGRMRFLKPGQRRIGPNERPPFGCCLLIWQPWHDPRALAHRARALIKT